MEKNKSKAPDPQRELPLAPSETVGERYVEDLTSSLPKASDSSLLAQVLERDNLIQALNQVRRNQGAPGIDGMTVDELPGYLQVQWPRIKAELIDGRYRPKPVKRVLIPKPDGRQRKLGIPTVLDRFIQQAIAQVVQRCWEPYFHPNSYGFRPGRNAHQAIDHAQAQIQSGRKWVVDLDLDAFFDRVNHSRLIHRLYSHVPDTALLRLINHYLKGGVLIAGRRQATTEGVPQGGPLSPVLANVVLDELDWELHRRGHAFARYADDLQVYMGSQPAGDRVMASLQRFIEQRLRLKVNTSKSAVDRPWKRTFLGFTFSIKGAKVKVSEKALKRLKETVRELSRRTRGHKLLQVIAELQKTLLGWADNVLLQYLHFRHPWRSKAYFDRAEVLSPLRDLDKWLGRKLRCYEWKQ